MTSTPRFGSVLARGLCAALLLACVASQAADPLRPAVKLIDAASAADAVARGTAFVINDAVFTSKQAFIESGARCGARGVGATQMSAWQTQEQQLLARLNARGGFVSERAIASVVVPTVVHVISKGAGIANGDMPQAAIQAQIQVLNDAFAASPFRFQLIETTRTVSAAWYDMVPDAAERGAKAALHRGGVETLNLYVASLSGGQLGYAYFPADAAAVGELDGVVVLNQSLPGGAAAPYNQGDNAVHQVGHWLGLYHTFEGGCTSRIGDLVADTAPEASPAGGCPIGRNTCKVTRSGDPIFNFMDYSDDSCMDHFTRGQAARMDAQHLLYRTPALVSLGR